VVLILLVVDRQVQAQWEKVVVVAFPEVSKLTVETRECQGHILKVKVVAASLTMVDFLADRRGRKVGLEIPAASAATQVASAAMQVVDGLLLQVAMIPGVRAPRMAAAGQILEAVALTETNPDETAMPVPTVTVRRLEIEGEAVHHQEIPAEVNPPGETRGKRATQNCSGNCGT
jgi:hypothetical protein